MKPTLERALKEIEGNRFFKAIEEGDLVKVSYRFNAPSVFDTLVKRELRGITFSRKTGEVVSRPFHKFFNVGEHQETEEEKLSNREFIAREKLHGTMLHPVLINGEVKLLTQKAFKNPQTEKGEELLRRNEKLYRAVRELLQRGYTPVFELISPKFQLVIPYDREELILTELRQNRTGNYLLEERENELKEMGFKTPPKLSGKLNELKRKIENAEMIEGYVLKDLTVKEPFPLFAKLKSPWYHSHHYAFTYLHNIPDHKLFNLFLQGKADDIFTAVLNRELRQKKQKRLEKMVSLYRTLIETAEKLSAVYGKPEFEVRLKEELGKIKKKHSKDFSQLNIREDYVKEAARIAKKRGKFENFLGTKLYTMLKAKEVVLKDNT